MIKPEQTTTVDLMRHGECEGGDIFRGSTDVELSKTGWETMQHMIDEHNEVPPWEHLISSPLQRCRQFAESISKNHDISLTIENNFRELHFGDWEGVETQTLWEEQKERFQLLYIAPSDFIPPNGEPMSNFQLRVTKAWANTIKKHRGKHLLLVQHGGTIRVLLTHLLSMPLSSMTKINVPYGCLIRFNIYHSDEADNALMMFHKTPVLK